MSKFETYHQWMRDNDAAGTVLVPEDAEAYYDMLYEDDPTLPEWSEIREDVLTSWEWRKGIAEMMSERAFGMFDMMFADILKARGSEG